MAAQVPLNAKLLGVLEAISQTSTRKCMKDYLMEKAVALALSTQEDHDSLLSLHQRMLTAANGQVDGTPSPSKLQAKLVSLGHKALARRVERLTRARHQYAHPDIDLPKHVLEALHGCGIAGSATESATECEEQSDVSHRPCERIEEQIVGLPQFNPQKCAQPPITQRHYETIVEQVVDVPKNITKTRKQPNIKQAANIPVVQVVQTPYEQVAGQDVVLPQVTPQSCTKPPAKMDDDPTVGTTAHRALVQGVVGFDPTAAGPATLAAIRRMSQDMDASLARLPADAGVQMRAEVTLKFLQQVAALKSEG